MKSVPLTFCKPCALCDLIENLTANLVAVVTHLSHSEGLGLHPALLRTFPVVVRTVATALVSCLGTSDIGPTGVGTGEAGNGSAASDLS